MASRLDPLPEFAGTRSTIAIGRRGLDRIKLREVGKSQALPQRDPLSVHGIQHVKALIGDKGGSFGRADEFGHSGVWLSDIGRSGRDCLLSEIRHVTLS